MGMHPNVILMAVLTPDDLPMKTMRAICEQNGVEDLEIDEFKIGDAEYGAMVMTEDYDKGMQIAAPVGSLVFYELVTYGYGEVIDWDRLRVLQEALDGWARETCERHQCSYKIQVTANHW